jgi:hypothetical protein
MNNMIDAEGTVHGVPHDSTHCATLCASGSVETLGLKETSRAINCDGCIQILANPDINSQAPPNHVHLVQAPELIKTLIDWYGTYQFDMLWSKFSEWAASGRHVAIYRNQELGHPELGHPRLFPYEGETYGQRLPDTASQVNWRYSLEWVYRTDDHKPDLKLSDVYRPADLEAIKAREAEQAEQEESDEEDDMLLLDDEYDDDEYDDEYEYDDDSYISDGFGNVQRDSGERAQS